MISGLNSTTSAPVYSVLDQRLYSTGPMMVDGIQTIGAEGVQMQTLWHGDVRYLFPDLNNSAGISVNVYEKKKKTGVYESKRPFRKKMGI
jgi:hypothetical protein